jgi:putative DNA primase/helicase
VWAESRPLKSNDPVLAYLRRRGIMLPLDDFPHTLRYHPHLRYTHDNGQHCYFPGMVARVEDARGALISLHRTYLTLGGCKANVPHPKKLMSTAHPGATRGAAIRLYPVGDTLAVTEGVETGLAVRVATGWPVWVAICARGMVDLVIPPYVHLVLICADHDIPGLTAAKALARRLLGEQRRVKLLYPDTPGTDWADALQEGAYA